MLPGHECWKGTFMAFCWTNVTTLHPEKDSLASQDSRLCTQILHPEAQVKALAAVHTAHRTLVVSYHRTQGGASCKGMPSARSRHCRCSRAQTCTTGGSTKLLPQAQYKGSCNTTRHLAESRSTTANTMLKGPVMYSSQAPLKARTEGNSPNGKTPLRGCCWSYVSAYVMCFQATAPHMCGCHRIADVHRLAGTYVPGDRHMSMKINTFASELDS